MRFYITFVICMYIEKRMHKSVLPVLSFDQQGLNELLRQVLILLILLLDIA